MKKLFTSLMMLGLAQLGVAQTTLVPYGSAWKYLDNGTNQGTTWKNTGFTDASWASGNAQLGYGDGDETTVVGYGGNSSAKYVTTYFRKVVNIANATSYSTFTLNVKRDDGIVVYVNGIEVYRNNMPTGNIAYNTYAAADASDDGNTVQTTSLSLAASKLVNGDNTIAVEIHQRSASSSDISFDFQLIGQSATGTGPGATVTRGPYLQKATSSSITLRWRTDNAVDSKVTYGSSAGSLTQTATVSGTRTEHTVTLTGLSAYTKYYYSIGTSSGVIQGDANNFFTTSPVKGTEGKYTFWFTGDCGNNSTNQKNVRDKYLAYMGTNTTNAWMLVGDNAYNAGTDAEYTSGFFGIYQGSIMKQAPLWPAPGNHDYANNTTRQDDHNVPYYSISDIPTAAEAGGVASGNEAYYSYDYGNVHFMSLDSYGEESNKRLYDTTGAQVTWIKQDLAANKQKFTVAYWHHPPYTMGSHNSDTESDLAAIRSNFIRILEKGGVDLIICGHSHVYERSKLLKGHYGNESTFTTSMNLSQSSGKYDGSTNSCTYLKDTLHNSLRGAVYVVSGSAGQLGGTQSAWPHNAMYYSDATNGGSMIVAVEGNRLDAKWLCADGVVRDQFTIIKDASKVRKYTITSGQSLTLKASWTGQYKWKHNNATTQSVTVNPTVTTTYVVEDQYQCVADTFKVTVNVARLEGDLESNTDVKAYPNPFEDELTIRFALESDGFADAEFFDLSGKLIATAHQEHVSAGTHDWKLKASDFLKTHGTYIVKVTTSEYQKQLKVNYSVR